MLVAPKGVRLDDVSSGVQKPAMNVTDHIRLRQGEEVTVVQQVLSRVFETLPADVSFFHTVGADRRTHRSVDDSNSIFEDGFQRMLLGFRHISLMASMVAMSAIASMPELLCPAFRRPGHAKKSLNSGGRNSSRSRFGRLRSACTTSVPSRMGQVNPLTSTGPVFLFAKLAP
jgi:hypothetical protein